MLTQFLFPMAEILLIEDDEIVLKALGRFLEKEGFTVQKCSNGKEGLKKLEENTYDLVITDLNMPSQERHEKTPVIVITSMGSESAITQCYHIGANDFIRKPIMPHELHVRIKKLLGSFV